VHTHRLGLGEQLQRLGAVVAVQREDRLLAASLPAQSSRRRARRIPVHKQAGTSADPTVRAFRSCCPVARPGPGERVRERERGARRAPGFKDLARALDDLLPHFVGLVHLCDSSGSAGASETAIRPDPDAAERRPASDEAPAHLGSCRRTPGGPAAVARPPCRRRAAACRASPPCSCCRFPIGYVAQVNFQWRIHTVRRSPHSAKKSTQCEGSVARKAGGRYWREFPLVLRASCASSACLNPGERENHRGFSLERRGFCLENEHTSPPQSLRGRKESRRRALFRFCGGKSKKKR